MDYLTKLPMICNTNLPGKMWLLVQQRHDYGVTNFSRNVFEGCSIKRIHAQYYKSGQIQIGEEVLGLTGKPNTVGWLICPSTKLLPKYLCLYSWENAIPSFFFSF